MAVGLSLTYPVLAPQDHPAPGKRCWMPLWSLRPSVAPVRWRAPWNSSRWCVQVLPSSPAGSDGLLGRPSHGSTPAHRRIKKKTFQQSQHKNYYLVGWYFHFEMILHTGGNQSNWRKSPTASPANRCVTHTDTRSVPRRALNPEPLTVYTHTYQSTASPSQHLFPQISHLVFVCGIEWNLYQLLVARTILRHLAYRHFSELQQGWLRGIAIALPARKRPKVKGCQDVV